MQLLMGLVGITLVVYLLYLIIGRFPKLKSFFQPDTGYFELFPKNFFHDLSQSQDIKRRAGFTLLMVVLYQLGSFIPIPGLDVSALMEFLGKIHAQAGGGIYKLVGKFSSGINDRFNLLTLGVMPYLSACVVLQFLAVLIRPLRRDFFSEDGKGRYKVIRNTFILSIILCAVQAYFYALWMESPGIFAGAMVVPNPGLLFRVTMTVSLVAGFCLILWLANLINERGVGHGIAILFLSDLFVEVILATTRMFLEISAGKYQALYCVLLFCLLAVLIVFVLFITTWKREIPVLINDKKVNLPLRLSWVGRMPVSWAMSFILIPANIASFVPNQLFQNFATSLTRGSEFYYVIYSGLIIFCAFLYVAVIISPEFIARLLKRYHGTLRGEDDTSKIENIFYSAFNRMTLLIGLLLVFYAILPDIIMAVLNVSYGMVSFFQMGVFLIIFGVAYDIIERIKARLEIDKFNCQKVCAIAFDEIEANIKKGFLESQGIRCVIEPLRFTWGLPIRTAADQYRLNVAEENVKSAQRLIERE